MNEQIDRGALADFLKAKGYMTGAPEIPEDPGKTSFPGPPFDTPPPVTQLDREPISFNQKMKNFLQSKGYKATGYDVIPEKPTVYKPVPVTDPRAPSREQVSRGTEDKFSFLREYLGKGGTSWPIRPLSEPAPYPGLQALQPGPDIPTPEVRPQEMLDRPVDYVPSVEPPEWWQRVKDAAMLWSTKDPATMYLASRSYLKDVTFGWDPVKKAALMIERISGTPGFFDAIEKQARGDIEKGLGYDPRKSIKMIEGASGLAGDLSKYTLLFSGVGAITKGLVGKELIRNIPVIQAAARTILGGTTAALLEKPEGEDTLGARIGQIPETVGAFALFEAGALTVGQIISMLKWNKAYGTAKAQGTFAGDYYDVDIAGGTQKFTTKQLRELFLKTRRTGVPPEFTEAELKILDDLHAMDKKMGWDKYAPDDPSTISAERPIPGQKKGPEFEGAATRAAKGRAPFEEGFDVTTSAGKQSVFGATRVPIPRKPRFFDIFRDIDKLPKYEPFAPEPPGPPKPPDMGAPRPGASNIPPEPPSGGAGVAPPPPGRAAGATQGPPEPRTAPSPTPRSRGGAPAVIVDVNPNPAGGWTYDFKIPQPEATAGPQLLAGRKPPAPEIKLTKKEQAARMKGVIGRPRKAPTKWRNDFWQILSDLGGVKPSKDYDYNWLKQYLPIRLINTGKNAKTMDEMVASINSAPVPYNFEYADELASHIEATHDFERNRKDLPKAPSEEEYYQEEIDNWIIDEVAAGRGSQLEETERLRSDELLKDMASDFDPDISLEDGVAKMKEILDTRKAEIEDEVLMEPAEKLPDFVTKDFDELLGPEDIGDLDFETDAPIKAAKKRAIKKLSDEEKARTAKKEFKLTQEEEVKPKKSAPPKKEEPVLIKKEELKKAPGKYPEGFNDIGWKAVPDYQNVIAATKPATAAGFNVDYGPFGKAGEGYVQIRGPKPGGGTGAIRFKSKAAAPPEFGTKAGQLGLDDEISGDLFKEGLGKKGLDPDDLVKTLNKLNISPGDRGEISISALENFDPKKGNLENYVRKIQANIKKRVGLEKAPKAPTDPKGEIPSPSTEPSPGSRFAKAEARAKLTDAVRKIQKNEKQGDMALRRFHTDDTFEEIGEMYGVTKARAKQAHNQVITEIAKDPEAVKILSDLWTDRITSLGILYPGKGVKWKDVASGFNKYFTTKKGVSKDIDVAHDKKVSGPIAELFQTTLDGKIVDKWIRKNNNAGLRDQVKRLLTGELGFDNVSLPENVPVEALKRLRNQMDRLSEMIMLHGGLEEDTMAVFEAGIGKYLGGFYRLYEQLEQNRGKLIKKYWDPPQDVRDRYAARLRLDDPALYGIMTKEEMDKFLDATLRGEDFTYKKSGRSNKVPTEHYKQQKNLSPEFIEFAGPIADPVWLSLKTVTKQSAMAYNAEFLSTLEDNPIIAKSITFDERKAVANGWQNHKLPNDYGYGRLRGAWVDPEIYKFIQGEINPQVSATERMIMKFIMNPFKWTNTIGSIPAHPRNFSANPMFSFLMRDSLTNPFNIPYFVDAFRIFWGRKGKFRNEWTDLIKVGITENQFWKAEIPEFYNELLKLDPMEWPEKIAKYSLKKPIEFFGTLYNFEDQFFRISAHLKNKKHFKMTDQESVDDINLSSPNYAKVPIFVDWLRKYPVLGPFISFKYNVARILINNAIHGGRQLGSKDPKVKLQGALRLSRLAFAIGLPLVLAKVAQKVFDVDPKEAKALEQFYPKHKVGSVIVYYREKDGKLKGYDFTYTYPLGDIYRAVTNLAAGDYESFVDSTSLFAHPIFDAFQVIIKGKDPYFGTPIEGGLERKAAELVKLLWLPKSFPIPSVEGLIEAIKTGKVGENLRVGDITTYQIENLIQAYHGQEDRYGRVRELPEELRAFFTGVKTWDIDPKVLVAKFLKQKQFEISDARSVYANWLIKNSKAAYWQKDKEKEKLDKKIARWEKEMKEAREARKVLTGVDYRTKDLPADVGKVKR